MALSIPAVTADDDTPTAATPYADTWQTYHRQGWSGILPLPPAAKFPPPKGCTGDIGADPSYPDMMTWADGPEGHGNLALRLPDTVIGVDIDAYDDKPGAHTITDAEQQWGALPAGPYSTSRDDGSRIRLFRVPAGTRLRTELPGGGVEIVQHRHRYVVCWPSIHPEQRPYRWHDADGLVLDEPPTPDELPELPPAWIDGLRDATPPIPRAIGVDCLDVVEAALTDGEPSERVAQRLSAALSDLQAAGRGSRYEATRGHVGALLRYGKQGDVGVAPALASLRDAYVPAVADARGPALAASEFNRLVNCAGPMLATPNNPRDDAEGFAALTGGRAAEMLAAPATVKEPVNVTTAETPSTRPVSRSGKLSLRKASTVKRSRPVWAWEFDKIGRIQQSALTIFAGRPAAGKSTTARWLAAGWTTGSLPGRWEGRPVNVLYVAAEESWEHIVANSLIAAGADMDRLYQVTDNQDQARINAKEHAEEILALCIEHDIRVVVCDPLLATLGGKVELYRSNEVRAALEPWADLAEKIRGVVLGIAHLTKAARDVTSGINGSSAFGEVARCVFGFATDQKADDGTRVLTQSKNSAGRDGLNLAFRLGETQVPLDDGGTTGMARFELIGTTDRTVKDLLNEDQAAGQSKGGECQRWLTGFLATHGKTERIRVVAEGAGLGFSESTVKRAAGAINVRIEWTREVPSKTLWSLQPPANDEAAV